jgi:hypothetical protein
MLKGVVAAGFEDKGKVENHGVIILPAPTGHPHFPRISVENGGDVAKRRRGS